MTALMYPAVLLVLAAAHFPKIMHKWPNRVHYVIFGSYSWLAIWFVILIMIGSADAH